VFIGHGAGCAPIIELLAKRGDNQDAYQTCAVLTINGSRLPDEASQDDNSSLSTVYNTPCSNGTTKNTSVVS
jgi:hypothetical protein